MHLGLVDGRGAEVLSGSYELDFESGPSQSGNFDAVWCEPDEPIVCG